MKKKLLYTLLIVLHTFCSCNDDYFDETMPYDDGNVYLNFQVSSPIDIETRCPPTTNERIITDAFVLVFNTDNSYKIGQKIDVSQISGLPSAIQRTVKVQLRIANGDKVVMLANTGIVTMPSEITWDNLNEKFPSINWDLNKKDPNNGTGMPMYGIVPSWSGLPNSDVILLKKSVAKISLKLTSPSNFNPQWGMGNHPKKGAIFQPNDTEILLPSNLLTSDFASYGEVKCEKTKFENTQNASTMFYIPPYPAATKAKTETTAATKFHSGRPCIIVKGYYQNSYYYYRLDFATWSETDKKYVWSDLKPNHHYIITIKDVKDIGYESIEEAMASPSNNILYDIEVIGPDDNVIISTGQYALELEYDNLIAYAAPRAELTIKARAIIPEGSAMPSTNSITSSDFNINYNMTSLTDKEQEFRFNLKNKRFVSEQNGVIKFKLGSITKNVVIRIRDLFLDAHCDERTFNINEAGVVWTSWDEGLTPSINGQQVTIKATENVIPASWYNYSTQKESNESDIYAEPVFKVRSLNGHLSTVSDGSRTKVIITQAAPDYVGWAGGEPLKSGSKPFSKRLIIEAEERYNMGDIGKIYETYFWSNASNRNRWLHKEFISGIPQNRLDYGQENTKILMNGYTPPSYIEPNDPAIPHPAAWECWRKNDRNGNGVLESYEISDKPWYLPSHYQMIIVWQSLPSFKNDLDNMIYMTSSELQNNTNTTDDYGPVSAYHSLYTFTGQFHYGLKEGYRMGYDEYGQYIPFYYKYSVRCVKDL